MGDAYLGEIRAFGFGFAPTNWAVCNGQHLAISQNTALFTVIGDRYGGDGVYTFALPDLQSRVAVGQGQGPGLEPYDVGEVEGLERVTLSASQMPTHSHSYHPYVGRGVIPTNNPVPGGTITAASNAAYDLSGGSGPIMDPTSISPTTGGLSHNNLMPYLAVNFCICVLGIFPPRG
jgi:microcystin-dependent protein